MKKAWKGIIHMVKVIFELFSCSNGCSLEDIQDVAKQITELIKDKFFIKDHVYEVRIE